MKYLLPFFFPCVLTITVQAQTNHLKELPAGLYETKFKSAEQKWEPGDLLLMADGKYKTTGVDEIGAYKFSSNAQRVFFVSGPLRGYYAITSFENAPVIIFPVVENQPIHLVGEVWSVFRR